MGTQLLSNSPKQALEATAKYAYLFSGVEKEIKLTQIPMDDIYSAAFVVYALMCIFGTLLPKIAHQFGRVVEWIRGWIK